MPASRAVYTALLGGYEELNEQPLAQDSGLPFICFTDDPELTSDTWQIVPVETSFPLDLVRSQRDLKIRGHEMLSRFDETLYIDNSVSLLTGPGEILDDWLSSADYAVPLHSFRDRVIDEFDEVVNLQYDDPTRVHEQLLHYSDLYPDALYQRPYWNGMLARRRNDRIDLAMRVWFDHVLRYSRRDQLSANVALSLVGIAVNGVEIDNMSSTLHRWPVEVHRKIHLGKTNRRKVGPLLAEIARLEQDVRSLSNDLIDYPRTRERADELERKVAELEAKTVREEKEWERQLESVMTSTSWRISAPVRWAGNVAHRLLPERKSN